MPTNPEALNNAREYVEKHGAALGLKPFDETPSTLVRNEELGKRVGKLFQRLPHAPDHPAVAKAYDALKKETAAQYNHLVGKGVKFEPWTKDGQPYQNSKEMTADVAANKRLYYFPTASGFGSGDASASTHPLYAISPEHGVPYNDLFRAVHDYFGHAIHGHEFGPQGEMRAWHEHAKMFSKDARPALSMDTHGQNSWVNFGPHNPQSLKPQDRPYAEQKANVLPEKVYPTKLARPKTADVPHDRVHLQGRIPHELYGLLRGVQENPNDHTPKKILADYLEESFPHFTKTINYLRSPTQFSDLPFHVQLPVTFTPKTNDYGQTEYVETPKEPEENNWTSVSHPSTLVHEYTPALQKNETRQQAEQDLLEHLDATNDPRADIIRKQMRPVEAHATAGNAGPDGHLRNVPITARTIGTSNYRPTVWHTNADLRDFSYQPVTHEFRDGTTLRVNVHAKPTEREWWNKDEPAYDLNTRKFHVMWTGFGPKNGYHTVMDPHEFYHMVDRMPEERGRLHPRGTFENNRHTQRPAEAPEPQKLARLDSPSSALAASMTDNADKRREVAENVLREAGISPAAVRTVLTHERGRGSRASVIAAITDNIDPGLSKYLASWMGLLAQEHALTVFHADDGGRDKLHVIHSSMPVDQLGDKLRDGGIPTFSLEEQPQGSRAYIYSHRGSLDMHIQRALGGTGARAAVFTGSGFKLGSDSGPSSDSRAKFRHAIEAYERGSTESAPSDATPRQEA